MSETRSAQLMSLAEVLEGEDVSRPRGAAAVRALLSRPDVNQYKANIPWIDEPGGCHNPHLVVTGNRYFPHLPNPSWPLLASFR